LHITAYALAQFLGLTGHDRKEELLSRLEVALKKLEPIEEKSSNDSYSVPSLSNISMGELRSRLEMMGQV
jgi:hypothetical protein